jgi:hypothetical protein
MLEKSSLIVLEILLHHFLFNLPFFAIFVGFKMPNANIGTLKALKRAEKEAKRAKIKRKHCLHLVVTPLSIFLTPMRTLISSL